MPKRGVPPIVWIFGTVLAILFAQSKGFNLRPEINGTPISVPGLANGSPTPTVVQTMTFGPGNDPVGTMNALAGQTLAAIGQTQLALGNITVTPTLNPAVSTETATQGPSPTPAPLFLQLSDFNETLKILEAVQVGYESSAITAGSQVGCDAMVGDIRNLNIHMFTNPFTGETYGYTVKPTSLEPRGSVCVTIQAGWLFSDLAIDWSKSTIGQYETVGTPQPNPNAPGQLVYVQKQAVELTIVAKRPACITGRDVGNNQVKFTFAQQPSVTWQRVALAFGTDYVTGMDAQFQNLYDSARESALSDANLKKAREKANESFAPGGKLYNDLLNLIGQTGNWSSITLKTEVLGNPNAPYIMCEDGTAAR